MDRGKKSYSGWRLILTTLVIAFVVVTGWQAWDRLVREKQTLDQKIASLREQINSTANHPSSAISPSAISPGVISTRELAALERTRLSPTNIGWSMVAAAALVYGIGLISSAMFWHTCLSAFGQHPPLRTTVAAHVLGQIGKYVPGKAMVIVIRSAALHRHAGIGRIPAAIGVFVETLTMMACGATLAGICVLLLPTPVWIRVLAVGLAIGAAIPTAPPLFHRVLERLSRSRFGKAASFAVERYDWKLMASGWGWMTLTWLLIGGSFWLILLATPGSGLEIRSLVGFQTALATIALAMVAGFLSLVPGGAGVRELVIAALLAPLVGTGVAVVAAIIARLTFLLVECTASGLSWAVLQSGSQPNPAP